MKIGSNVYWREDRGRRAPSQPPDTRGTVLCDAGVPGRAAGADWAAE